MMAHKYQQTPLCGNKGLYLERVLFQGQSDTAGAPLPVSNTS